MPTSPRLWNLIAARYARQPVADAAAYARKLAVTRALLRPDMEVFEFGCGTGTTALKHADAVRHITAIDFSPKMIAIARDKAAAAGVANVDFQVATIEDWAAPDASYDAILGMSILHLIEDRTAVLSRVRRLLRPGGRFFSSTTCRAGIPRLVRPILPLGRAVGLLPLVRLIREDSLVAEIEAAGFAIEERWRPSARGAVFIVARAI